MDNISDDTKDALEMMGLPIIGYEPPGQQVIETKDGLELVDTQGWIKFSAAFRNKMLKQLRGAKLAVFISIGLHVNDRGQSYPGIEKIAEETGYSRDEVMETVAELEGIPGLLQVDRKRGRHNIYRPSFVAFGRHREPVGETTTSGGQAGKVVGVNTETSGGCPDSKKSKKNQGDAPSARDAQKERVAAILQGSTVERDGLIGALHSLTGRDPTIRNSKTNSAYIACLREKKATPDQCRKFSHYWQVTQAWRGPGAKPALVDVVELWDSVLTWKPEMSQSVKYKDIT